MRPMNGLIRCVIVLILFGGAAGAQAQGPLQVQNRFPLHLVFLTPRPTDARLPAKGAFQTTIAVDYSSVYVNERQDGWSALVDMEMGVVDVSIVYGLTRKFSIGVQVPLVSMNSGFLDGFLENYHDAFGFSNYGREERPDNRFAYEMRKNGRTWIQGDTDGFSWADATVSGQLHLFEINGSGSWIGSLVGSIKLPTGDEKRGYGSGRFDAGLFVPTQWEGERWAFYLMPGYIWRADPETRGADVSAKESFSLFGGASYIAGPRWHWYAQLNCSTTPIEKTGISLLDDGAVELTLGFRRILSERASVEVAFCEDLFTQTAPDFNLHLALVWSHRVGN